ncbi:MAG: PQQ-binding-like beta-propeller repeat protein [Planctomycetota bacterium]
MGLRGDLANIGLAQIFQTLLMGQQEGILKVTRDGLDCQLLFTRQGVSLLDVRGRHMLRLGRLLVNASRISQDDLEEALLFQESRGGKLGEILVERGKLSEEELSRYLTIQSQEQIFDVFNWTDAQFEVIPVGEAPPRRSDDQFADHMFDPNSILLEAARRIDEWSHVNDHITDLEEIYVQTTTDALDPIETGDPFRDKILGYFDGQTSIRQIIDATFSPSLDICKAVLALQTAGWIRPATTEELLEVAALHTESRHYEDAINVLRVAHNRERARVDILRQLISLEERLGRNKEAANDLCDLAILSQARGDEEGMLEILENARTLDPRSARALEQLFEARFEREETAEAIVTGRELAALYHDLDDYERSCQVLDRLIALDPDNTVFRFQYAQCCRQLGREADALLTLQEVGRRLEQQKLHRPLIETYRKILEIDPKNREVNKKVRQLQKNRRRSRAQIVFAAAVVLGVLSVGWHLLSLSRDQEVASAELATARALWSAGDLSGARTALLKLIDRYDHTEAGAEGSALLEQIDVRLHAAERREAQAREAQVMKELEHALELLSQERIFEAADLYTELPSTLTTAGLRQEYDTGLNSLDVLLRERVDELTTQANALLARQLRDPQAALDLINEQFPRLGEQKYRGLRDDVDTLTAAPKRRKSLEESLDKALDLYRRLEPVRAELETDVAKTLQLKSTDKQYGIAYRFEQAGRIQDAIQGYRRALEVGQGKFSDIIEQQIANLEILDRDVNQAKEMLREGRYNKAHEVFDRLVLEYRHIDLAALFEMIVWIDSYPQGAPILLDGQRTDLLTPAAVRYAPGKAPVVRIEAAGYEPLEYDLREVRTGLIREYLHKKVLWQKHLDGAVDADLLATPLGVIVGTRAGTVQLLSLEDGRALWSYDTESLDGLDVSAAVAGDRVYVATIDGTVICLSTRGRFLWRAKLGQKVLAPPIPIQDNLAILARDGIRLLAVSDGRPAGTVPLDRVGSHNGFVQRLGGLIVSDLSSVSSIGLPSGKSTWRFRGAFDIASAPITFADQVVVNLEGGGVACLTANSGGVNWRYSGRIDTAFDPLVFEDRIYTALAGDDGELLCLDRFTGERLPAFKLDTPIVSPPTIADGRLYVGGANGELYVWNLSNQTLAWKFPCKEPIASRPAVTGGRLFVATESGRMLAFDLTE